jgi:hypothetical protein
MPDTPIGTLAQELEHVFPRIRRGASVSTVSRVDLLQSEDLSITATQNGPRAKSLFVLISS